MSTAYRISLAVVGTAALFAAAVLSPASIEHALRRPAHILEWGPTLFRIVLVFNGIAALTGAWRLKRVTQSSAVRYQEPLSRKVWMSLAVLTFAGLAVRLVRLDLSLWIDEVLTVVYFVRPPLSEIISSFPFQNQHLLYSLATHGIVAMFGESAVTLRLLAVILGTLTIPALFFLGRHVAGQSVAFAAAALMTFSYHHVWFSQNARGYSGIVLFAVLSTWFWLRALEGNSPSDWTAYVIATVLGTGIHMTMLFITLSQLIIHAVILFRNNWQHWRRAAWSYALAGSLTLQLYALALPDLFKSGVREVSLPSEWTNPLWLIRAAVMNFGNGVIGLVVIVLGGIVAMMGIRSSWKKNPAAAASFVLPPLIAVLVVLGSGHNVWPRLFFFAIGFGLLIAMEGVFFVVMYFSELAQRASFAPRLAACTAFMLVTASAATVPRCYRYPKQDFIGARDYVDQSRTPQEAAVAVGTAALVYKIYYAPNWVSVETAHDLESLQQASSFSPWLVYTLPIEVKTYRPDIWRIIETEYRPVKVFPGTLQGGGEIYVCRRIAAKASVPAGGALQ